MVCYGVSDFLEMQQQSRDDDNDNMMTVFHHALINLLFVF